LPSGERPVEAVLATDKILESYQILGSSAGVKLRYLVLRPYASTSLLRHFQDQENSKTQASLTTLLVDRIGAEVDLIATHDNRVLLWRTMQLDEDPNESLATDGLISEIVRIVAIAPAHLPEGRTIEKIQWLGSAVEHAPLAAELARQTRLPVEILDPASLAAVSGGEPWLADGGDGDDDSDKGYPSDGAAPLLAMLLDEANGNAPALDLLNPRKPPQPRNSKRIGLLAAIAGVILLYLAGTWLEKMHADRDHQNVALSKQLLELRKQRKKLAPQLALARSIATWEDAGIVHGGRERVVIRLPHRLVAIAEDLQR